VDEDIEKVDEETEKVDEETERPQPIIDEKDIRGTWKKLFSKSLGTNWMTEFTRHADFELSGDSLGTASSRRDAIARCTAMPACAGVNEGRSIHLVGMGLLKRKRGSTAHLSGRFRHIDFYRCAKYLLGDDVQRSDKMNDPESAEDTGEWSCLSALIRRGTLGVLDQMPRDTEDLSVKDVSDGSVGTKDYDNDGDWENSLSWEPLICGLAKKEGKDCKVTGFGLPEFKRLRELPPAPARGSTDVNAALLQAVKSGPLRNLNPGAGKSGSTFASSFDGFYKVKLGLVRMEMIGINEPRHLMKLVTGEKRAHSPGPTIAMADHFQKHPDSSINRVYAMLRVDFASVKSYTIWMEDAGYNVEAQLALADPVPGQPKPEVLRYDMKGNRLSRRFKEGSFTLAAQNFFDTEGRFGGNDHQCLKFRKMIRADNEYLYNHKTIDYSFFVEVVKNARGLECDVKAPLCLKRHDTLYTFTTIDTVRDYDFVRDALAVSGNYDVFSSEAQVFATMLCPMARERRLTKTYFTKFNKKLSWDCNNDLVICAYEKAKAGSSPVTWEKFKQFGKDMGFRVGKFKKAWKDISGVRGIDDFGKLFEK
jgi:hypothetical protein